MKNSYTKMRYIKFKNYWSKLDKVEGLSNFGVVKPIK